jgi:hypothetical protein
MAKAIEIVKRSNWLTRSVIEIAPLRNFGETVLRFTIGSMPTI